MSTEIWCITSFTLLPLEQHRLADKAEVDKLLFSSWNYLKLVLIMSQDTIFRENVTIKINIINRWLEGLANSIASLKVLPASNQRWCGVVLFLLFLVTWSFGFGMRDDRFGWFVGVEVWAFFVFLFFRLRSRCVHKVLIFCRSSSANHTIVRRTLTSIEKSTILSASTTKLDRSFYLHQT